MFTGFNDGLMADDVHYNEAGSEFIANRYYNVLVNVLEYEKPQRIMYKGNCSFSFKP